jgi:hypothetical protein
VQVALTTEKGKVKFDPDVLGEFFYMLGLSLLFRPSILILAICPPLQVFDIFNLNTDIPTQFNATP